MRESIEIYPRTAAERAMKLQEVLLRATSGKIKWWQAAELMGSLCNASCPSMTPDEHLTNVLLYLLQVIGGSPGLPLVVEVDFRRGFLLVDRPFGRPLPCRAPSLREDGRQYARACEPWRLPRRVLPISILLFDRIRRDDSSHDTGTVLQDGERWQPCSLRASFVNGGPCLR